MVLCQNSNEISTSISMYVLGPQSVSTAGPLEGTTRAPMNHAVATLGPLASLLGRLGGLMEGLLGAP